jgi:hypothetical protein
MLRRLITTTVSAAICLSSVLPGVAAAQEYRFTGADAPRGVSATVNLRVPLGRENRRPTYGLTFGYGQTVPPGLDGRTATREMRVADFRFSGDELRNARVVGFDLANPDQSRRRMNLMGGADPTLWIVVGAVAAGAAACFIVFDCFDDDDDDTTN